MAYSSWNRSSSGGGGGNSSETSEGQWRRGQSLPTPTASTSNTSRRWADEDDDEHDRTSSNTKTAAKAAPITPAPPPKRPAWGLPSQPSARPTTHQAPGNRPPAQSAQSAQSTPAVSAPAPAPSKNAWGAGSRPPGDPKVAASPPTVAGSAQRAPPKNPWGGAAQSASSSSSAATAISMPKTQTQKHPQKHPQTQTQKQSAAANTNTNAGKRSDAKLSFGDLAGLTDAKGKRKGKKKKQGGGTVGGGGALDNQGSKTMQGVTVLQRNDGGAMDAKNDKEAFPSLVASSETFPSLGATKVRGNPAASSAAAEVDGSGGKSQKRGWEAAAGAPAKAPPASTAGQKKDTKKKSGTGGDDANKGTSAEPGTDVASPNNTKKKKKKKKDKQKDVQKSVLSDHPLFQKQRDKQKAGTKPSAGGGGMVIDEAHAAHMINFFPTAASGSGGKKGHSQKDGALGATVPLKKGRQRLGPRKKRLSTLKKRVLQERLRVWRVANNIPEDGEEEKAAKAQGPEGAGTSAAAIAAASCSVCLRNYVDPEELDDDDEYDEIVADLVNLAEKIGPVGEVYIPRDGDGCGDEDGGGDSEGREGDNAERSVGLAFVRFAKEADARAAAACWDMLTIGGSKVQTSSVTEDGSASSASGAGWRSLMRQYDVAKAEAAAEGESTKGVDKPEKESAAVHVIILQNILTEDDFDDEDCLEETKQDIQTLTEQYGKVVEIAAHTDGDRKGEVHVSYEAVAAIAEKAAAALQGMVIGGHSIVATVQSSGGGLMPTLNTKSGLVLIEDILTEDDYDDEDCLGETVEDIMGICKEFGEIESIKAYTDGEDKGQVHVIFSGGGIIAESAVSALNGKIIGGEAIKAYLPSSQEASKVCNDTSDGVATGAVEPNQPQTSTGESSEKPPLMMSGDKFIPERYAECKRAPKVPNAGVPRAYATKIDDDDVIPLINEMLGELMRLQLRSKDDKNARARRRLVMGLREVARGIRSHKVRMVIMANNLDEYGAIDEKLQEILDLAEREDVPVFFELSKRRLGKSLGKSIKVAVCGIQNADGAHQQFKKLQKIYAYSPRKKPEESTE